MDCAATTAGPLGIEPGAWTRPARSPAAIDMRQRNVLERPLGFARGPAAPRASAIGEPRSGALVPRTPDRDGGRYRSRARPRSSSRRARPRHVTRAASASPAPLPHHHGPSPATSEIAIDAQDSHPLGRPHAIGKLGGGLASVDATELGGTAIQAALEPRRRCRAGRSARDHGQVLQSGQGQIPRVRPRIQRVASPEEVPSERINKVCAFRDPGAPV